MNKIRYAVKLNMKDVGTFNTGIRLKQGDSAITFVFRIYSGDNYLFDENDVPHIVFKRPDGSSVVGEMSVIEGQYTYNLKGNELEIGGNVIADVKFNMYGDRGSTSSFMFECVPDTLSIISQGAGVYVNDLQFIYEDILNKYLRLNQLIHEFDYESIQRDVGEITTTLNEVRNLNAELKSLVPVNNLLATVPGSPLDAVQGKALSDFINSVNTDLSNMKVKLSNIVKIATILITPTSHNIIFTPPWESLAYGQVQCMITTGYGIITCALIRSTKTISNVYLFSGVTKNITEVTEFNCDDGVITIPTSTLWNTSQLAFVPVTN